MNDYGLALLLSRFLQSHNLFSKRFFFFFGFTVYMPVPWHNMIIDIDILTRISGNNLNLACYSWSLNIHCYVQTRSRFIRKIHSTTSQCLCLVHCTEQGGFRLFVLSFNVQRHGRPKAFIQAGVLNYCFTNWAWHQEIVENPIRPPKMHCRWSSALWTAYHIVGRLTDTLQNSARSRKRMYKTRPRVHRDRNAGRIPG